MVNSKNAEIGKWTVTKIILLNVLIDDLEVLDISLAYVAILYE